MFLRSKNEKDEIRWGLYKVLMWREYSNERYQLPALSPNPCFSLPTPPSLPPLSHPLSAPQPLPWSWETSFLFGECCWSVPYLAVLISFFIKFNKSEHQTTLLLPTLGLKCWQFPGSPRNHTASPRFVHRNADSHSTTSCKTPGSLSVPWVLLGATDDEFYS